MDEWLQGKATTLETAAKYIRAARFLKWENTRLDDKLRQTNIEPDGKKDELERTKQENTHLKNELQQAQVDAGRLDQHQQESEKEFQSVRKRNTELHE
jgi:predicted  nucleic acid-binding Zn-ribbon protein